MLVTITDLIIGLAIIGSLAFTAIYILDHIGKGKSYFKW